MTEFPPSPRASAPPTVAGARKGKCRNRQTVGPQLQKMVQPSMLLAGATAPLACVELKELQGAREGQRREMEVGSAARRIVQTELYAQGGVERDMDWGKAGASGVHLPSQDRKGTQKFVKGVTSPKSRKPSVGLVCSKAGVPGGAPTSTAENRQGSSWTNLVKTGKEGKGLSNLRASPHCRGGFYQVASQC